MKDIKQISDKRQGIIVNQGFIISMLLSFFVQLLFIDR